MAAAAIRDGVNLGDLQALLGHADPSTTRIYAPFQIERQREVSAQMAPYLADVLKPRLVTGGKKWGKVRSANSPKQAQNVRVSESQALPPRGRSAARK